MTAYTARPDAATGLIRNRIGRRRNEGAALLGEEGGTHIADGARDGRGGRDRRDRAIADVREERAGWRGCAVLRHGLGGREQHRQDRAGDYLVCVATFSERCNENQAMPPKEPA